MHFTEVEDPRETHGTELSILYLRCLYALVAAVVAAFVTPFNSLFEML